MEHRQFNKSVSNYAFPACSGETCTITNNMKETRFAEDKKKFKLPQLVDDRVDMKRTCKDMRKYLTKAGWETASGQQ